MPHLKCEPCRVRVQRARDSTGPADLCPLCGEDLRPVTDLAEIVGFRSIEPLPTAPTNGLPGSGYERLAASVAEIMARRRTTEGLAWREAERWAP
jgi:hypothetical protein